MVTTYRLISSYWQCQPAGDSPLQAGLAATAGVSGRSAAKYHHHHHRAAVPAAE